MEFLTSAEAAAYLRMKERKLYDLVAERTVPCTKITGRWLFPKADLDRWVLSGLERPPGLAQPAPAPIVGGSHDPLLEWALRESGSGLAILAEGSEAGLSRFLSGEVVAAAIHLHGLDDAKCDANVEAVRGRPGLQDAVLIAFVKREQGLVVSKGNPLRLSGVADLAGGEVRVAQRQRGAGAQLLLMALLKQNGIDPDRLAKGPVCPTGADLAQAIQAGRADAGIASRSVTAAAGLDFVPLLWERFDLVMRQRDYFCAAMQKLLTFVRTQAFVHRASEMSGYDVMETGTVRHVD